MFNSTVALQVGLLKHLGDVATVLLDLVITDLKPFFSWCKYSCSNNFDHHCKYT